ncbi:hypothetical protein ABZP36_016349 [Zizania latifolia]
MEDRYLRQSPNPTDLIVVECWLTDAFLDEEMKDEASGMLDGDCGNGGSVDEELIREAQYLKSCGVIAETPSEILNWSKELTEEDTNGVRIMAMKSQAEALGQLATDDLKGKFALLETSSVDDDLAQMKKELSGSATKRELPLGGTIVNNSGAATSSR